MNFNIKCTASNACFLLLLSVLLPSSLYAKDKPYEYELFASYSSSEDEMSSFEENLIELGISIFDLPVGYGDYPYLETNFFERRAHLDFSFANRDFESTSNENQGNAFIVNYSFVSQSSPLLFNIGGGRLLGDGTDVVGSYDLESVLFLFGIGYYVTPNAVARLEITAIDHELTDDNDPTQDYEYDENHYKATWHHILKVHERKYLGVLLGVEAIEVGSTKSSEISLLLDYFFNKKASIGLVYKALRGDVGVVEGDEFGLRASLFMDGQLGLTAEISRLYSDLPDSDEDSYQLNAVYRFD